MAHHQATIVWTCNTPDFMTGRYSREHTWSFDGGFSVPASSSPAVVRAPLSNPAHVDPEEAYVASISSCHMLTYLHLARVAGFEVKSYQDEAVGETAKNDKGMFWIPVVTLNPRVVYGDKRPSAEEEERLHHQAHEQCFISQSVKSEVKVVRGP